MTNLSEKYLAPFDRIYGRVTELMRQKAATLGHPDQAWLDLLIDTFREKRKHWNTDEDLEHYRKSWLRLQSRLLRLAAGAYLHVVYDLSRCIADDWPGQGKWRGGPSLDRGRQIYSEVETVFSTSLRRVTREYQTVGLFVIAWPLMPLLGGSIENWLLLLRAKAWEYAGILSAAANRSQRETALARAMAAALEDVSDLRPWRVSNLRAPTSVLYAAISPALFAAVLQFGPVVAAMVTSAATAYLVSRWHNGRQEAQREATVFVAMLGQLIAEYSGVAVRSPDELDLFLLQQRVRLGLKPRGNDQEGLSQSR